MKIDSIHIDGFGLFHQFPITGLSSGLTIFKGANEAGKSTLLSFMRRILFGFPSSRTLCNLYPPIKGGNHGGRLVITKSSGESIIIERYAAMGNDVEITFPDGSKGGKKDLSEILGYADKDIFENIYAFGLDELQSFETLRSDAVNSRLYSAGTGIGSISISDLQNSLKKKENDLYRKQGRKPPINKCFIEIKNVDGNIREMEGGQRKYDSLHFDLDHKSKNIEHLKVEQSKLQKELNHINDLISIWDDWRNINDSQTSLEDLPEIVNFPEKGMDKLERIQEKMEELSSTISSLQEDLKKNDVDQKDIQIDDNLLKQKDKIVNLGNGIEKYRSDKASIPVSKSSLQEEESSLLELFQELGQGWNEEKLEHFDHSIPAKEDVIQKRKAIDDIEDAAKDTQNELNQISKEIKRIIGDIEKIDEKIKFHTIELSKEEVDNGLNAVRYLRGKYPLLKEKESDLKGIQKDAAFYATIQPPRAPFWPAGIIIFAGIIGLIYGYLINELIPGAVFFIVILVTSIIYILSIRKREKSVILKDDDTSSNFDKTRDFPTLIEQVQDEKNAIRNEMLNYSKSCGFSEIPEPTMLEQKAAELEKISNEIKINKECQERREKLTNELNKLNDQYSELDQRLKTQEEQRTEIFERWKEWLSKYDLDPSLSPESILEIFSTIKLCYDKQKTIHKLESQLEDNKKSVKDYEEKIISILEQSGRSVSGLSFDTELEILREDVDIASNNSEKLNQLEKEKKKIEIALQSAESKFKTIEKELSELMGSGSSENEEEFSENARIWAKRVELQDEIQKAERQFKRISGDGKEYDNLIGDLEKSNLPDLRNKTQELEEKLESLSDDTSTNTDERGAIRNQIKQLENRHEGSKLLMERGAFIEDLHKKSRDWAVLVLAQEILAKAIEVYEKERQPGVIVEAQSFFSKITDNRYKRIYSPLGSSEIYVEDYDKKQKNIIELSRGTAEQLYLALRFGFTREFGKHSESLPIVFDDILVNFDPDRAKNAGKAIKELTETNQILYFTCHPETVEMFMEVEPGVKIIDLDSCIAFNHS